MYNAVIGPALCVNNEGARCLHSTPVPVDLEDLPAGLSPLDATLAQIFGVSSGRLDLPFAAHELLAHSLVRVFAAPVACLVLVWPALYVLASASPAIASLDRDQRGDRTFWATNETEAARGHREARSPHLSMAAVVVAALVMLSLFPAFVPVGMAGADPEVVFALCAAAAGIGLAHSGFAVDIPLDALWQPVLAGAAATVIRLTAGGSFYGPYTSTSIRVALSWLG